MLVKFLGWIWIIAGVLFLLNPDKIKEWLKEQNVDYLKKAFAVLAFLLGILLVNATWGVKGILARIILVCGFIAFLKGIYLLKAKSADSFLAWFLDKPIKFLRLCAVFHILFGALILTI